MPTLISMEMDFLAHRAPCRNRYLLLILLLVISCNNASKEATTMLMLDAGNVELDIRNGVLFVDAKPFTGRLFGMYPNKKDTQFVNTYELGLEDGEWRKYHENGKLFQQRYYSKGSKVKRFSAWWENGRKQMDYFFEQDEYEGTCSEWNQEGRLIREMNYSKGYEQGSQKQWYDNGEIRSNYIIKKGRRYGLLGTKNCINVADSVGLN